MDTEEIRRWLSFCYCSRILFKSDFELCKTTARDICSGMPEYDSAEIRSHVCTSISAEVRMLSLFNLQSRLETKGIPDEDIKNILDEFYSTLQRMIKRKRGRKGEAILIDELVNDRVSDYVDIENGRIEEVINKKDEEALREESREISTFSRMRRVNQEHTGIVFIINDLCTANILDDIHRLCKETRALDNFGIGDIRSDPYLIGVIRSIVSLFWKKDSETLTTIFDHN